MSFNTPISSIIGIVIISSVGIYSLYKQQKNKNLNTTNSKLEYKVFESELYTTTNPARVYKYNVSTASFDNLESSYKRDLYGNYKKKEHVDKILQEYLKKNPIVQKRIVIDTKGWVADFNVKDYSNSNTIIFNIENDSLQEASLDGKNKSLF